MTRAFRKRQRVPGNEKVGGRAPVEVAKESYQFLRERRCRRMIIFNATIGALACLQCSLRITSGVGDVEGAA